MRMRPDRNDRIACVMTRTTCTRDEAVAYLEAEEWFVDDAIESIRADRRGAAQIAVAQSFVRGVLDATK
jgi:hypothetical protein